MDLKISDMMQMQRKLHKLHEEEWYPLEPEYGRNSILFMIEEVGETIAIVKKKGDAAILEDPQVRQSFLEEMADVLMYYTDALLRYHVTEDEISKSYLDKHLKNVGRDYAEEYKELYHGQE